MQGAYSAQSVRAAEADALDAGVPLMRRAAMAVATRAHAELTDAGSRVVIFAGGGNNGGDGTWAAVDLAAEGVDVTIVLCATTPPRLDNGARAAIRAATASGVEIIDATTPEGLIAATDAAVGAAVWVDALLGLGSRPPATGPVAGMIDTLNDLRQTRRELGRAPVVIAVDLPSGISADSGAVSGPVLAADITLTFGGRKPANLLPPAAPTFGETTVVDIGISEAFAAQPAAVARIEASDVARWWPRPAWADHKYTRGVVGLVTGSRAYPGAAVLSVAGALAAGPGMVRYLGPADQPVLAAHPEAVTAPGRVQSWVLGSGTGDGERPWEEPPLAAQVAADAAAGIPVIIDAGAIAAIGEEQTFLGARLRPTCILTPHAGELADLLTRVGPAVTRDQVEADPAAWAVQAAHVLGATITIKGPITVIASPDDPCLMSQADGTAWMASAGTGDVLAGVLGTVLAQWHVRPGRDQSLAEAIAVGVYVHGVAGTRTSGGGPVTASRIAEMITPVVRDLLA